MNLTRLILAAMKDYRLSLYILLLSLILTSCGNDKEAPNSVFNFPSENRIFYMGDQLSFNILVTDDQELKSIDVEITGPDNTIITDKKEIAQKSYEYQFLQELSYNISGEIQIKVTATDCSDNQSEEITVLTYFATGLGSLNVNFKLTYDGVPLVMFEEYIFPDGKKMNFTRFSFYISKFSLGEEVINEIDFLNLTNNNATVDGATNGYDWLIESVPVGSFDNLSFNIGVPSEDNAKNPGNFPSGHPLAKPSEHWFGWGSYIFLKVEGNIDMDGDGSLEKGIGLHLGADSALRSFDFSESVLISAEQTSHTTITIDLKDFFTGEMRIYPIEEAPQIHSLSQQPYVTELADNLEHAIHM